MLGSTPAASTLRHDPAADAPRPAPAARPPRAAPDGEVRDGEVAVAGDPGPPPSVKAGGRSVLGLLLTAVGLYVAWGLLLFVFQRNMIYLGQGLRGDAAVADAVPGLRRHWIEVPDGRVEAWFLPPHTDGPAPAFLFTHGNGELIDHWVQALSDFARQGVGVMLVEYPGYGRSTGRPSEATIAAAMLGAYDALAAEPEVDPARIVAYGRSLGGGAAATLLSERALAALVLESSFTTTRAFARHYLLPGFLVRDRFEVLEAVRDYAGPVLVIHGTRDAVVPYSHGAALAEAARDGTLVTYDCGHNDCPPQWGAHVARVVDFFAENGLLRREGG